MYDLDELLQAFTYEHLPPHLASMSQPFCELAYALAKGDNHPKAGTATTGHGPLTGIQAHAALWFLLLAKDAAVRAVVFAHKGE